MGLIPSSQKVLVGGWHRIASLGISVGVGKKPFPELEVYPCSACVASGTALPLSGPLEISLLSTLTFYIARPLGLSSAFKPCGSESPQGGRAGRLGWGLVKPALRKLITHEGAMLWEE